MDPNLIRPQVYRWATDSIRRVGPTARLSNTAGRRGLLLVHLDGVPRGLLERAVAEGRMPFLASLITSGAYRLDGAFWGSPASTPCFQAGLLYGLRHPNLPAYHWFDREQGRMVRMNVPRDARAIEDRLARTVHGSLLEGGGTAYLSLFRADAANQLCMSALSSIKGMARSLARDLRGIRGPSRHGVLSYLRELIRDSLDAWLEVTRWAKRLEDWRHEREYLLNRFFLIHLAWDLAHTRAIIDMVRGVPAIYLVFGNFDEVAHRRGPLSEQATRELFQVDVALEELFAIAKTVPHPYDVYFLTDHGHVASKPLEQITGRRLEKYLLDGAPASLTPELTRALLQDAPRPRVEGVPLEEPVFIEAGNFAHVYLSRGEALNSPELVRRHEAVLARAVESPEIGIVALRRGGSAVAIIRGGVYSPDEVARSPLSSDFSKRALADLLRELPHMPTAGDLVLYGQAKRPGETVGFAWEFGSHGGLTEIEVDSLICWPTDVPLELSELRHSTELHQKLSSVYRH